MKNTIHSHHLSLLRAAAVACALLAAWPADARVVECEGGEVKDVSVAGAVLTQRDSTLAVDMTLSLDELRVGKSQQITFQPVVSAGSDSVLLQRVVINGRDQQLHYARGNRRGLLPTDMVVRRNNGEPQTIDYHSVIPWQPWMDSCSLRVTAVDCRCGRVKAREDLALAAIIPPEPPEPVQPLLAFVRPEAEVKTMTLDKRAYITFVVDKTYMDPTYQTNPQQLDSIIRTINVVKSDPSITINNIEIHGFASPESPYEHNAELASGRAQTLRDYVAARIPDLPSRVFTSAYTPENWDALRDSIRANEDKLPHAVEILACSLDEAYTYDAREWLIKSQYPEDYRYMVRTFYPWLRRSDYHITYTIREFTAQEADSLVRIKPQVLNLNEMFLAANLYEQDSADFAEIMEIAVRLHPESEVANLNAALTRIKNGDCQGARRYVAKAGDSPQAENARGILALYDGDLSAAKSHFDRAAGAGLPEAQYNATLCVSAED